MTRWLAAAILVFAAWSHVDFNIWPRDTACDRDRECQPGECTRLLASLPSPDGARTALVFLLTGGGATVANSGAVCVDEGGQRRKVAVGYRSDGMHAAWESATRLRVEELASGARAREVDVTSGEVICEPVRADWNFCTPDGRATRR